MRDSRGSHTFFWDLAKSLQLNEGVLKAGAVSRRWRGNDVIAAITGCWLGELFHFNVQHLDAVSKLLRKLFELNSCWGRSVWFHCGWLNSKVLVLRFVSVSCCCCLMSPSPRRTHNSRPPVASTGWWHECGNFCSNSSILCKLYKLT